ncbi:MAG TPA: hypothetical protein VMD27_01370 [Candidatus Aquilonibacter sp.]|nr:hypothetical protein [Candidatus Aquilonibacter sp.]
MKTKLALFFSLVTLAASAQTNSVHTWTLKTGAKFTGDYFTSGTEAIVIKSHGTNCLLKISDLSTNDWLYFQDCKAAQRQHQLDAEATQMRAAGQMEFTSKMLENFPEKVMNQQGWMDGTFEDFSAIGLYGDDKDFLLGFWIKDKSDDAFDDCVVFKKNPHDDQPAPELAEVMNLKQGDRVRFFGCPQEKEEGDRDLRFYISHVEMIESAADAAAIEKVKEDLQNSQ